MKRFSTIGAAWLAMFGLTVAGWSQQEQQPERPRPDAAKQAEKEREKDRRPMQSSREFIEKYDKNGDGILEADEVPAEMKMAFGELDLNKDGQLTAGELEHHARRMERVQRRQRPADMITIWIIENRDVPLGLTDLQQSYELLRRLDKDNDGEISREEFENARAAALTAKLDVLMRHCDKNKDGRISETEAQEHIGQRFAQFDLNRDGFLDRAEVEQAVKQHNNPATGPRQSDAKEVERKENESKERDRKPVER